MWHLSGLKQSAITLRSFQLSHMWKIHLLYTLHTQYSTLSIHGLLIHSLYYMTLAAYLGAVCLGKYGAVQTGIYWLWASIPYHTLPYNNLHINSLHIFPIICMKTMLHFHMDLYTFILWQDLMWLGIHIRQWHMIDSHPWHSLILLSPVPTYHYTHGPITPSIELCQPVLSQHAFSLVIIRNNT